MAGGRLLAAGRAIDDDMAWGRDHVMPFASLWEPWALACRDGLGSDVDATIASAWQELHLQQCAHWGIRAAHAYFGQVPPSAGGSAGYRQWVSDLLAAGCEPLFQEYPVLGRMLAQATEQSIAAGAEFAQRLAVDRPALERELGVAADDALCELTAVGDQHQGGRQVLLARFASGARLIYKPRSIAPEETMARVVAHVRAHGGIDCEITPRMVARERHGWSAFVETAGPGDHETLVVYSRRAGAATAIAHATATHDLHLENVIVAGDRPVFVDLECIASAPLASNDTMSFARRAVAESVLSTYLLPIGERDDPLSSDICGLTGVSGQLSGTFGRSWLRLGTAEMSVEQQLLRSTSSAARPSASEMPLLDIDAFCSGLRTAALVIADHGLGIDPNASWPNRVVLCDTQSYAVILQQAFEPENLRDGLSFSIALDAISTRAFDDDAESWRPVLAVAERAALERLDVPLAHGDWRTTDVRIDAVTATGVLTQTGADRVAKNIADLSEHCVHLQAGIARIALETRLGAQVAKDVATGTTTAGRGSVEETCVAIGEEMLATMVALGDSTYEWLAPTYRGDRLAPTMGGQGLYGGSAGCALYLAALARYTGRADFGDAAAHVLAASPAFDDPTLGDGQAGWAYAATVSGRLLADEALVVAGVHAARAAASVAEQHLDLDLMAGVTGVALALAAVAATAGDDLLGREAATLACTARKQWSERVQLNWVEANRLHRLGVAHGVTGTSLAVARVLAVDDDAGLRDWLLELVAAENDRIERRGGVPGRVSADAHRRPDTTWCWGVAGFAAARIVVAECLRTAESWEHIDRAREILGGSAINLHRLCCGSAGWLGVLPEVNGPQVVGELVAARGRHQLEDSSSFQSPSLFRGTAGVGYQLLRTLDVTLPDVLTFAPAG